MMTMTRIVAAQRSSGHRLQRGQALVFTLLFTASAGLVALMLFNSGMLANTKTKLQNAADAAAYSAAVLQARDNNFSAYSNRAMVANQVAVAQLVSLKSFADDAALTRGRMDGAPWALDFAHWALPAKSPLWDAALDVKVSEAASAIDKMAGPAVTALDKLIFAFMEAERIHSAATAVQIPFVAGDVITRNDSDATLSSSAFMIGDATFRIKKWSDNFAKRYSANDTTPEADRFANVVVDQGSTDSFIRNRDSLLPASWASKHKICFLEIDFTWYTFEHGGGTLLSSDKHSWMALDATAGLGNTICGVMTPWGFVGENLPILDPSIQIPFVGGSAGALAGQSGYNGDLAGYRGPHADFWQWGYGQTLGVFGVTNPQIWAPAYYRYGFGGPGTSLDSKGGLQDYYRDVADPLNQIPKDQTPEENGGAFPITIEAEHAGANIRTSSKFLTESQVLAQPDHLVGGVMRALASAHAYFYRPRSTSGLTALSFTDDNGDAHNGWERVDGKTELANLFSPYWQARLVETPAGEKISSAGAQGLVTTP